MSTTSTIAMLTEGRLRSRIHIGIGMSRCGAGMRTTPICIIAMSTAKPGVWARCWRPAQSEPGLPAGFCN